MLCSRGNRSVRSRSRQARCSSNFLGKNPSDSRVNKCRAYLRGGGCDGVCINMIELGAAHAA